MDNSAKDDTNTQLNLQLTESDTIKNSTEAQNSEQLNLKLGASDGNANAEKDKVNSENEPAQSTNDLNLKMTESEHSVAQNENSDDLILKILQTEDSSQKSNADQEDSSNKLDDITKDQTVNGHNTTEDDSILSDKGSELKLKLSVSDSDNMEVDDAN